MKVNIGDKVRFLNEVGGGIVRKIKDKLVYVEDENGFEIPSLASELVVIKEYDINKHIKEEKKQIREDVENKDIDELIVEKEHSNILLNKTQVFKSGKKDDPPKEIDLHINKILDDFIGLSNAEIIEIQLNCFRTYLNKAIKDKERKIVFIHGIGNGTLKKSLRQELETFHKKKCYYQDASFKEYGFGATLVIIRQNNS